MHKYWWNQTMEFTYIVGETVILKLPPELYCFKKKKKWSPKVDNILFGTYWVFNRKQGCSALEMELRSTGAAQSLKCLTLDFRSGHEIKTYVGLCTGHGICLRFSPSPSSAAPSPSLLSLKKERRKWNWNLRIGGWQWNRRKKSTWEMLCTGLCPQWNSCVKALNPSTLECDYSQDRTFEEVIKLK